MKRMKIIIGYDGSACADAAIDDLRKAGLPRHADALVLSAADVFLPAGRDVRIPEAIKASIQRSRAAARNQVKQATMSAKQASTKIKSMFPGWNVKSESGADSPAWAILKRAEGWKPDLIVVGAHGHSKLGRFLGSVSQMVLTQTSCSIRVGRASPRPKSRSLRVLIGIDGSSDSKATVQSILSRSWPSGAKFLLVSVIDPMKSTFIERLAVANIRWFLEQALDERGITGRMLESFAKKLRERNKDVTCRIRKGDPRRVLVKEAEAWQADCIFVGARGLTHVKRFFIGGVSTAVAARAHCSVEVVRLKTTRGSSWKQ